MSQVLVTREGGGGFIDERVFAKWFDFRLHAAFGGSGQAYRAQSLLHGEYWSLGQSRVGSARCLRRAAFSYPWKFAIELSTMRSMQCARLSDVQMQTGCCVP